MINSNTNSKNRGWNKRQMPSLGRVAVFLLAVLMSIPAFAQNIKVSGNVTDNTGEPLIGATVQVVGTTVGTATDIDGNFTLNNVNPKAKLLFSYVGYNPQTIEVKGQNTINVVMAEDSQSLDELVVVGYGTMKKSDLTGAVSSVNTKEINAKGAPSVLENLQGTTPGVNITKNTGRTNGGISIEIRGKSSIESATTPLFVVDGIICGDIDFLNPQDIERVDVLKDASSTAIYGSRASAGVVIVTTKGGLTVNKNQKASITYDGYYGFNHAARLPNFSTGEEFYRQRVMKMQDSEIYGTSQPTIVFPTTNQFLQCMLATEYGNLDCDFRLKQMVQNGETTDWPDLVLKDGHQQNHYVAIAGSGENVNYHFGVGLQQEDGIYKKDESKGYNFKGSVDARVNKVISGGFNFNLAYMENSYADNGGIENAYKANPFNVPFDADGKVNEKPGASTAIGSADGYQFTDQVSPLLLLNNSTNKKKTYRVIGNVYLQLDIIKGLNIKTTFSPSYTNTRTGYFAGYENPDKPGFTYANTSITAEGHNSANVETGTSFGWTWDNTINYNATFGGIHSVTFLGLVSLEKGNTEKYKISTQDVLPNTDWWNVQSGNILSVDKDKKAITTSNYGENSMLSYALRGNYSLMDRYMLTATVRWDGCSKFRKEYHWGTFPSFAVAWRISEESFLRKNWLNNLKLRFSYGISGNNKGVGNYDTVVAIGSPMQYPFGTAWTTGMFPGSFIDATIHWEKSHEYNGGLDFGFLNNRISGSIDLYHKNSKDLLYNVTLPLEAGGGKLHTNIGRVVNKGVEVALTTVNVTNKDWEWSTTFTFAHNKNKIKEIDGVSQRIPGSATGSLFVGESLNTLYGKEWGGIVNDLPMTVPNHEIAKAKGFTPGETVRMCDYYYAVYGLREGEPFIVDQNGDGNIDNEDKILMNGTPKWTGSVTSNLSYKLPKKGGMVDFSFSLYAKQGFKVYSPWMGCDQYRHDQRARNSINEDFYMPKGQLVDADGMNPDGTYINPTYMTQTHYGDWATIGGGHNMGAGNQMSEWNDARKFVDGSFVKVKNITLGYTFSKELLKKIACQQLRLYFTVSNPFVWTKYKGWDPEWADAAAKNDGPSIISYQIGASIKF